MLQRAADIFQTPLPPLPGSLQSSPQEHRSRRGSTAELDGEVDNTATGSVRQGSSKPARRRRTGTRIAQHLQPSCREHGSCKRGIFMRCDGATEQEENVTATAQGNCSAMLENEQCSKSVQDTPAAASQPATAAAADDAQQTAETMSTVQGGADDIWPQSNAVEESDFHNLIRYQKSP